MTCITVDAPDAMFLAGRDMIPTHNSWSVSKLMILRMAGLLPDYEPRPVRIVSCRDFNTNLDSSVKVVVEKHIRELGLDHEFRVMNTEIRHHERQRHDLQGRDAQSGFVLVDGGRGPFLDGAGRMLGRRDDQDRAHDSEAGFRDVVRVEPERAYVVDVEAVCREPAAQRCQRSRELQPQPVVDGRAGGEPEHV